MNPARHPLLGLIPDAQVARLCGVSRERVRQVRAAAGLPSPQSVRCADARARVCAAVEEGALTAAESARRAGVPPWTAARILRRAPKRIVRRLVPGACRHGRKHDVADIVAAVRRLGSIARAAEELGYHPTTLYALFGRGNRGGKALHLREAYPDLPDGRTTKWAARRT